MTMAQDFGDDIGEMLLRPIGQAVERSVYNYIDRSIKDWYRQMNEAEGMSSEEADLKAEAMASREQVCIPFGDANDAACFAQVCRESGTYAAALSDKEGNGYIQFAKDDLGEVQACAPQFSEVITRMQEQAIADRLVSAEPLTKEALAQLTLIDNLPDLPKGSVQKDVPENDVPAEPSQAAQMPNHTEHIRDEVASARSQCRDFDDFKRILAGKGIGITATQAGEVMFYEARTGADGSLLPYDRDMRDWAVGAGTLKQRYGVDATHDSFDKNMQKGAVLGAEKALDEIRRAVRADLEESGIPTYDKASGDGFRVSAQYKDEVIRVMGKHAPGKTPEELGIEFFDPSRDVAAAHPEHEPEVADGSLDTDGSTPDINQGVESHDGMDTDATTLRLEREQNGTDIPPSTVREEAARSHDDGRGYSLDSAARECRAASKQLERESGIPAREIDISDKLSPVR